MKVTLTNGTVIDGVAKEDLADILMLDNKSVLNQALSSAMQEAVKRLESILR